MVLKRYDIEMELVISENNNDFTGMKVPFIGLILGQTSLVSLSSVCGIAV